MTASKYWWGFVQIFARTELILFCWLFRRVWEESRKVQQFGQSPIKTKASQLTENFSFF